MSRFLLFTCSCIFSGIRAVQRMHTRTGTWYTACDYDIRYITAIVSSSAHRYIYPYLVSDTGTLSALGEVRYPCMKRPSWRSLRRAPMHG